MSGFPPPNCRLDVEAESLWPLPLTAFEEFMVADDRREYPMAFFGELRFAGNLRREAFTKSVAAATDRHPLLRAVVRRSGTQAEWAPLPADMLPTIDWGEGATVDMPDDLGFIDLTSQHGVRFWVRVCDGTTYLLVQFHHACCDGHGAMRYLEDVLTAYAGLTNPSDGAAPTWRATDVSRLKRRGVFTRPAAPSDVARRWWHPLRDAWRFHMQPPSPLAPSRSTADRRFGKFPGTISRFFDDEESRTIRQRVTNRDGTTNDAAVTAILRTLRDWNRLHGTDRGRLRVLVPMDLRTRGDELTPAANRMTFSFLTRNVREIDDPVRLLASVRDETQYVKRTGTGLEFLDAISFLRQRGWMQRVIGSRRCLATAVLTNMGDPTRRFYHRFPRLAGKCVIGDVVLQSITGSPPLRPLTNVGFGIGTYAGLIVINTRCDPHAFTPADTETIAAMFDERLLDRKQQR